MERKVAKSLWTIKSSIRIWILWCQIFQEVVVKLLCQIRIYQKTLTEAKLIKVDTVKTKLFSNSNSTKQVCSLNLNNIAISSCWFNNNSISSMSLIKWLHRDRFQEIVRILMLINTMKMSMRMETKMSMKKSK